MSKTTLLIDADPLIYAAGHAAEKVIQWDEDEYTYHAELSEGQSIFKDKLAEILDNLQGDPILCLSDSLPSFRRKFWPQYKGGRGRRPLLYGALREWVMADYRTYLRPELEADDILGILATHPKIIPGDKIMVSIDKDLAQVPGLLAKPGEDEPTETSEAMADYLFAMQTLTGDTVDNYPGCPGIGPKKAVKALEDDAIEVRYWPAIVTAYEKAGLTEDDALIQARCARILRASDYDFKSKEPILWTPTATTATR